MNIILWWNNFISHRYCGCWFIPINSSITILEALNFSAIFIYWKIFCIIKCSLSCWCISHPLNLVFWMNSCPVIFQFRVHSRLQRRKTANCLSNCNLLRIQYRLVPSQALLVKPNERTIADLRHPKIRWIEYIYFNVKFSSVLFS